MGKVVRIREQADEYRAGKITAVGFYITLAEAFGPKRAVMIPKVACSLPLDKARALVAAAGLGDDVLADFEREEGKLQALRDRRRRERVQRSRGVPGGTTMRDVQLWACRVANRLLLADQEQPPSMGGLGMSDVSGDGAGGGVAGTLVGGGAVTATARLLRMFEASDLLLMREVLGLAITLVRHLLVLADALGGADNAFAPDWGQGGAWGEGWRYLGTESRGDGAVARVGEWLRPHRAARVCQRVGEFALAFPRDRVTQLVCCSFAAELGSLGPEARRCLAMMCEPVLRAIEGASGLDRGGGEARINDADEVERLVHRGQGSSSLREAACRALSALAQERGLARRLVGAGAARALMLAMASGTGDREVQLHCLGALTSLVEHSPGMWVDAMAISMSEPCQMVVSCLKTFARDTNIQRKACRAAVALMEVSPQGEAAQIICVSGGGAPIIHALTRSPNDATVQLPAILALNAVMDGLARKRTTEVLKVKGLSSEETSGAGGGGLGAAGVSLAKELIAAGACELLVKSARNFPRDRDLREGCLKAMASLCHWAGASAGQRLVNSGVCEQIRRIVEAFPGDLGVREGGLSLLTALAEHSGGEPGTGNSNAPPIGVAVVANRLGRAGGVELVATSLMDTSAPGWYWKARAGGIAEPANHLLLACKAAALLCGHCEANRDSLMALGACEALARIVALSNSEEEAAGEGPGKGMGTQGGVRGQLYSGQERYQVWGVRALAGLASGEPPNNSHRCMGLVESGALTALFAAMARRPDDRPLQHAGCLVLGHVARGSPTDILHGLGKRGGGRAVVAALQACPDDRDVALAGLAAVAKLAASPENRQLLGAAGVCGLVSAALKSFVCDQAIAKEGCRAIAALATQSGFNRTALGHTGAVEAVAEALRCHPAVDGVQHWGITAAADMVADTDPSANTSRLIRSDVPTLVVRAMGKLVQEPTTQTEGLRALAKMATQERGVDGGRGGAKGGPAAVWEAGVLGAVLRPLRLYANDVDVQHWGLATMRALSAKGRLRRAWCQEGSAELVSSALLVFGKGGGRRRKISGESDRKGQGGGSRGAGSSDGRGGGVPCSREEALCVQFQACACTVHLAEDPEARRELVQLGTGEALAVMMAISHRDVRAQRGGLAALAALSAAGAENRERLAGQGGSPGGVGGVGVPRAVVLALAAFPTDARVQNEGALALQNLSLVPSGARALVKAGVAPVLTRLLDRYGRGATDDKPPGKTQSPGSPVTERGGGTAEARHTLVYLLNGLANLVTADDGLCAIVGRQGVCESVVSALRRWPQDLQLQAAGCKAVCALALRDAGSRERLVEHGAATSIVRSIHLFWRDREVQLAGLGATEALCHGGHRAGALAFAREGAYTMVESVLRQFSDDPEVVRAGLKALVEMLLAPSSVAPTVDMVGAGGGDSTAAAVARASGRGEGEVLERLSLSLQSVDSGVRAGVGPFDPAAASAAAATRYNHAVGIALAAMDSNPHSEVCEAAFDALLRLIAATNPPGSAVFFGQPAGNSSTNSGWSSSGWGEEALAAIDSIMQWAKVTHAVKRALKINHRGGGGGALAKKGQVILSMVTVARGKALSAEKNNGSGRMGARKRRPSGHWHVPDSEILSLGLVPAQ
ncbi:unnamed protein product [Discosporangium mesarthrocarpum]